MPKQNSNNIESTIEINSKENANTVSPPAPKILIRSFIAANAIALSMTPMAKQTTYCVGGVKAHLLSNKGRVKKQHRIQW